MGGGWRAPSVPTAVEPEASARLGKDGGGLSAGPLQERHAPTSRRRAQSGQDLPPAPPCPLPQGRTSGQWTAVAGRPGEGPRSWDPGGWGLGPLRVGAVASGSVARLILTVAHSLQLLRGLAGPSAEHPADRCGWGSGGETFRRAPSPGRPRGLKALPGQGGLVSPSISRAAEALKGPDARPSWGGSRNPHPKIPCL